MAKKKQLSYGEMQKQMEKMAADMEKEKERMAGVMAAAFMTDATAAKLGNRSDADLKRIMSMLAGHIDECIATLDAEKQARAAKSGEKAQAATDYPAVVG